MKHRFAPISDDAMWLVSIMLLVFLGLALVSIYTHPPVYPIPHPLR